MPPQTSWYAKFEKRSEQRKPSVTRETPFLTTATPVLLSCASEFLRRGSHKHKSHWCKRVTVYRDRPQRMFAPAVGVCMRLSSSQSVNALLTANVLFGNTNTAMMLRSIIHWGSTVWTWNMLLLGGVCCQVGVLSTGQPRLSGPTCRDMLLRQVLLKELQSMAECRASASRSSTTQLSHPQHFLLLHARPLCRVYALTLLLASSIKSARPPQGPEPNQTKSDCTGALHLARSTEPCSSSCSRATQVVALMHHSLSHNALQVSSGRSRAVRSTL